MTTIDDIIKNQIKPENQPTIRKISTIELGFNMKAIDEMFVQRIQKALGGRETIFDFFTDQSPKWTSNRSKIISECGIFIYFDLPDLMANMIRELLKQLIYIPIASEDGFYPLRNDVFKANFEMLRHKYLDELRKRIQISIYEIDEKVDSKIKELGEKRSEEQAVWTTELKELQEMVKEELVRLRRTKDNINDFDGFQKAVAALTGKVYDRLRNVILYNSFFNLIFSWFFMFIHSYGNALMLLRPPIQYQAVRAAKLEGTI